MARFVDRFSYRVTWSDEDQEYVGLCAEFPSLSWLEKTPEKALSGMRKLVKQNLDDLQVTSEPIPEPIALKTYSGKFMVRVPPETHRALALQALESGVSLRAHLSMHKWHIMGIKLAELRFKMLPICLILLASCALLCRIFYLILHSSCINRGALK